MSKHTLAINGITIEPGERKVITLDVARLPSGTAIPIVVHIFRSSNPGPTMLVLGGMHGDEVNGVEIVRRMLNNGLFEQVAAGTVIAIPLLNVFGFINFSRAVPDGKDVNRSFPGSRLGSLASRVAYHLTKHILPVVDFIIDYHTGGGSRYNFPQIRYSAEDEQSEALAMIFAPPFVMSSKRIEKSLRNTAFERNIPLIVFEGGEALRFDGFSIRQGIDGLRRVMQSKGMLADAPEADFPTIIFEKTRWIRTPRAGIFLWKKHSGQYVEAGEQLGTIYDPDGQEETPIFTKKAGYIFGHNNAPVVHQGDALFHMGTS